MRSHLRQWLDNSSHGTGVKRLVPGEHRQKWLGRQETGKESDAGPAVPAVERPVGFHQTLELRTTDGGAGRSWRPVYLHSEGAKAGGGCTNIR